MLNDDAPTESVGVFLEKDGSGADADGQILASDRTAPRWVSVLSALFAAASAACLLAVPVLAFFFQSLPETEAGAFAAFLLAFVGAAAVAASLVLEYAGMRAVTGFRSLREAVSERTGLWLGGLVSLSLCVVHPLLGLGTALAAGLAVASRFLWRRAPHGREPWWDFDRNEAVALLSGRDGPGLRLALAESADHPFRTGLHTGLVWLAVVVTLAAASALAHTAHLGAASIPALGLLSLWATDRLVRGFLSDRPADAVAGRPPGEAARPGPPVPEAADRPGLVVRALGVRDGSGRPLLSDVSFDVPPGSVVCLAGDSGAGKSLLLAALQDPANLAGLAVQGHVLLNGMPLWHRSAEPRAATSVWLPEQPILLPVSGLENLTCFAPSDTFALRGRRLLEKLVFSVADAEAICAAPDARNLPGQQRRLLAFARAFLLSPGLYLMDRPETGLADRGIAALRDLIQHEKRLGRCILVASENRAIQDICDTVIVLQEGRLIDMGTPEALRARQEAGWTRLVAERVLDSEDNLVNWVRNLFKRPGDEGNRRAVGLVAAELLALSCQSADSAAPGRVEFDFKHQRGSCILRMADSGPPISTATLDRARKEQDRRADVGPLAAILSGSSAFSCHVEAGRRLVEVQIATYDPRLTRPAGATDDVPAQV